MRATLRGVGWVGLAVAAAALLWIAGVAIVAYRKAPQLVRELERSNQLSFDPATLPASRICALVAVQDRAFFRHDGIGLFSGPLLHTTMTQSVCKGLFFRGFSPGLLRHRKIMLMADAWAFDRRISKDTQLRIFVNRAYFGNVNGVEILGFKAAAAAYFGRDVLEISDREYFALVAMLVAPATYHVAVKPEVNSARVRWIEAVVETACTARCIAEPPHAPCDDLSS
ncbi:MAG TPA: transglycosylase domain-containing protein [Vicinamibacteria bacterium]|nr:transglycosylase domain-containing protein [Vicinamibacteria bacterium]